jgi:tRNA A37 threonylcarbamoyladenosine synthetase subunit TsaC/SUA5/YrdC
VVRLLDVDGAESGGDAASTVVDLTGESPRVLRWGAIPRDEVLPMLQGLRA